MSRIGQVSLEFPRQPCPPSLRYETPSCQVYLDGVCEHYENFVAWAMTLATPAVAVLIAPLHFL